MSTDPIRAPWPEVLGPDVSHLVTEDGAPVDNVYSERQMRLLVEPLYASWEGPPTDEDEPARSFFAAANVGLFAVAKNNPLVPDVLLSVDVDPPKDVLEKAHRSYFVWEFGKVPDVVIEVVSNREGGELTDRKRGYARMRVPVYVVWDPALWISDRALTVFELRGVAYQQVEGASFASLGLSLREWEGEFEGLRERWLRWVGRDGAFVETGRERAQRESERAQREGERAERERARAEALAVKLRALGIDPDDA
jgi:Uma2 family endonuclease